MWIDPLGLEKFACKYINENGGGAGDYKDDKKVCTYSCTGKKSGNIVINSNSSVNIDGSEFCRGAVTKTTLNLNNYSTTTTTDHFDYFTIDTESWWDSWGRTSDIYDKLKEFSESKGKK